MKKLNFLFGLATMFATVFTFSSCSSEELSGENKVSGRQVNFTSAMKGSTRATSDPQSTTVPTDQKIGVFGISNETSTTMNNYNNIEYTVPSSGGNLTTTNAMTWPTADGAKVNFYAYAPYNSDWDSHTTAQTFTVESDQSAEAGYLKSDLLFATPLTDQTVTTNALALAFVHKMAKLNITLNNTGTSDITISSVKINNTLPSITFTPSNGTLGTEDGTATDITAASNLAIAASGTATVCAVIVPQPIAANTTLVTITTSNSKTLIAKLGTATTFANGDSYNFTVNIDISESTPATTEVVLSSSSTAITEWNSQNMGSSDNLYAKFGSLPGNANCTYNSPLYKWTAASNNLIPIFESLEGKLANYKTLVFNIDNLFEGNSVRLFFDNSTSENNKEVEYKNGGRYVIDLESLGITGGLSTVTQIRFGGKSSTGQCNIDASNIYLSTRAASDCPKPYIFANPVMQGGANNGGYSGDVYNWTAGNSNLMDCFTFNGGELANYSTLIFNIRKFSDGAGKVRMGYYIGSTYTPFNNEGYSEAGVYTIDLINLGITLSNVNKISFGGKDGTGNVLIKASEIILK